MSSELLQKAQQFTSLIEEFRKAEQQLQQVWSGHAADSAVKKIEDSLTSFTQIVDVINKGAQLLQQSATLVKTAQTGYTSVVGAVNPTVAGLMSNPYTYSAAVALSTSTSGALKGFITTVSGLLKTLGAVNLASELSTVGADHRYLGTAFQQQGNRHHRDHRRPAPRRPARPVTAPVAPGSVGSTAGLPTSTAPSSTTTASTAASSSGGASSPTSMQTGEQALLHTPDGKLYTADGQPLLTANGTPAYQNYQPAALSGLPNTRHATAGPAVPSGAVPPAGGGAAEPAPISWLRRSRPVPHAGTLPIPGTDAGTVSCPIDSVPQPDRPPASSIHTSGGGRSGGPVGHRIAGDPGTGEEITVTTTHAGTTTTVEVPIDATRDRHRRCRRHRQSRLILPRVPAGTAGGRADPQADPTDRPGRRSPE